ncbi:MAG TPA: hypothetical protein ENK45_03915 [Aliiroseovarius sp.]|nr:hypothetical protein [Aliiroseovarius sp.]
MTKLSLIPHPIPAAAALIIALGVGVAASSESAVTPLPLSCAVEMNDTGRMVEITARLAADAPIDGTYSLEIVKHGKGGSAHMRQGGAFDLEAGDDATLGRAMMSGNPQDFDVDFTLEWNGKTLTCPTADTDL